MCGCKMCTLIDIQRHFQELAILFSCLFSFILPLKFSRRYRLPVCHKNIFQLYAIYFIWYILQNDFDQADSLARSLKHTAFSFCVPFNHKIKSNSTHILNATLEFIVKWTNTKAHAHQQHSDGKKKANARIFTDILKLNIEYQSRSKIHLFFYNGTTQ